MTSNKPDFSGWKPISASRAPVVKKSPSPGTIFAILGGCLFVFLLLIVVIGAGFAFYIQRQNARAAQEMARIEQQQAVQAQARAVVVAAEMAAQQERAEKLRQDQERMELERIEQIRKMEEQARIEAQLQQVEQEARHGMDLVQAALFDQIPKNDPDRFIAPGPPDRAGLSWRVHLLPALGLKALHSEFHLDEPWDSEHNKTLISRMPTIFGTDPKSGKTQLRSFLRLDGSGDGGEYTRVRDVLDGSEQTALLFYVGQSQAITWTQPDNVQAYTAVTPDRLGLAEGEEVRFTVCGHRTVFNLKECAPELLQALCSLAGGEHLDERLITGQLTGSAAVARLANMGSAGDFGSDTLLNPEQEFNQAHAKLKKIAEAMVSREKAMASQKDAQTSAPGPLSWRVHLLPFLGEDELYAKFDLSQPWDSEANLPLASQMPEVFQLGPYRGRTRFILSLPEDCQRTVGQLPAPDAITDAPDLTTLFYLVAPQNGVTWTKPDSLIPVSGTFQESFGWAPATPVIAATFAATTVEIPGNLHTSKLSALISIRRGELFDLELALRNPEQQLRLSPSVKPAEPIADLIKLPKQDADPATLKPAEPPADAMRFRTLNRAIQRFYDERQQSPTNVQLPGGVRSPLSWRVHLLPYLEQKPLYDRFKLDEAWDSETNLALLEFMPEIFRSSPGAVSKTRLRVLSGSGSLFAGDKQWMQAPDGFLNTIMLLETGETFEQEWTRPDLEIELSSLDYRGLFGSETEIRAMLGSGQVLRFTTETPGAIFRALATSDGNEIVDGQTVQRWLTHQRGQLMFPPAVEPRFEAEQMKNIALAAMNYHDVFNFFPPQQRGDSGEMIPLRSSQLSWRVHLLPFLGHTALYKQFRLEEPWDSPHNQQLLSSMPDCFRDANDPADSHTTRIVRVMGPGTPFPEPGRAAAIRDVTDGTSQTIHFIQASSEDAVPWTQPEDISVDLNDVSSLELLTNLASTPTLRAVTFDGAVRTLAPSVNGESFKGLITPSGQELLKTQDLFLEQ
ncbi:MAG: DUF1559 domain-containing protein [Planctomyces sp.]|nr:DUF1559 domain-containing protein [Planctomyces sp.]